MKQIKSVEVYYNDRLVGTLAETKENLTAFQYSKTWLSEGFSICPFSLPLSDKLFFSNYEPFGGLFGVFDDCLPDGWGMLLTDRMLRSKGLEPTPEKQSPEILIPTFPSLEIQYDGRFSFAFKIIVN